MYTINQVAAFLKVNPNAIRFYEKKGLISPHRKENGYREFMENEVSKLHVILIYRKMGFSIEAIQRILSSNSEDDLLEIFAAQYEFLNEHIHAMQRIRNVLGSSLESMISDSQENEDFIESMKETAEIIEASNRWRDLWNFDGWAKHYDADIRKPTRGLDFYAHYDEVLEKTAARILKGCIVEIGIGTGNLAKLILDAHEDGSLEYIGVDQSMNMLKLAKEKCPDASVKLGAFLKLPLEDRMADTIVTSYAFHHCNEIEKKMSIAEMDRVLKSSGKIIITDLMFKDHDERAEFEASCSGHQLEDLNNEFFGTVAVIEETLKSLGYCTESEQVDDLIWIVMGQK